MHEIATGLDLDGETRRSTLKLFKQRERENCGHTDRMFAWLLVLEWLAGIGVARWLSPRTWAGQISETHIHVWAAIFLGGVIAAFPVFLAVTRPGEVFTRHAVGIGQMLSSSLLIHLTGGRIETHFQIFGSLAFLAFYRDWRVLVSATLVVAADHILRGTFWPMSIFGVQWASPWRWLEHVWWVLFEDVFLFLAISQNLRAMFDLAEGQAIELRRENLEREKAEKSLDQLQHRHELIVNSVGEGILWIDRDDTIVFENPAAARTLGWQTSELSGRSFHATVRHSQADGSAGSGAGSPIHATLRTGAMSRVTNELFRHKDGSSFPVEYTVTPLFDDDRTIIGSVVVFSDVTEKKRAEDELSRAGKDLLTATRVAGMAEVATNVLHNVGNVLNSVNVSASLVTDNLRKSKVSSLARAVTMLQEHENDLGHFITADPRGKHLPVFLAQLAEHLQSSQDASIQELGTLQKNIDHIRDIVAMQQNYATVSGVKELINITDLVEDSLRMNTGALTRHQVEIIREFEDVPLLTIEKHKFLQILVNLVRNAKYACDEGGSAQKRMTLRITSDDGLLKVSVIDNGIGIPEENLTRIFNNGFTTRTDGHGFGLHSSAIAAKEMGGALRVHSDGPNKGASFTLELPLQIPEEKHE